MFNHITDQPVSLGTFKQEAVLDRIQNDPNPNQVKCKIKNKKIESKAAIK
jgi:hypothetical protein